MIFEDDKVQMRVHDGVFELFQRRNVISPYRTPLDWVKVQAQVRKRGAVLLHFSYADDRDTPLYGRLMGSVYSLATVEITMAEEPRYRAFFAELAELSGRPIQ